MGYPPHKPVTLSRAAGDDPMSLHITDAFDSGNIEVLDAADPQRIRLEIRKDNGSDFYQWFHFRVTGARGSALSMAIENAGGAGLSRLRLL
jgi:hypothetical protein